MEQVVVVGDGPRGLPPPADTPTFTAQEEAFLRAYSETLLRREALIQAGMLPPGQSMAQDQQAMQQAGEVVGRAEQLPWSQLALALGADRVYFLSRLKTVCDSPVGHIAIKGLNMLARIHGLFEKQDGRAPQTALVFVAAQSPQSAAPPDLPFTMSRGDYRMFTDPDNVPRATDNENGEQP